MFKTLATSAIIANILDRSWQISLSMKERIVEVMLATTAMIKKMKVMGSLPLTSLASAELRVRDTLSCGGALAVTANPSHIDENSLD